MGPVFTISVGPKKVACVVGPEPSEQFLRQPGTVLSVNLATKALRPVIGQIGFPDDENEHRWLLRALTPLMSPRLMDQHVVVMLEQAARAVAELGDVGRLELVGFTERLSQTLAMRCLLGDQFVERVGERFREAYADLVDSVDLFLPPSLPLPKFRRRDRARRYIDQIVIRAVQERRAMGAPPDDAMQRLSTLRSDDGSYRSMQDTVDLIVTVLFGGHHTTGALMAWTMIHLLQHPEPLARVQEEIDRESPSDRRALERMAYLCAAIRESERLQPPTSIIPRIARQDLEIGGYRIRKGWMVLLCPPVAHRLASVFEDPGRYDPERFLGKITPPRYALVGFGGGVHACIGKSFASLAVQSFVASLLRSFEIALVDTPQVGRGVLRRPATPCRLSFRSRASD